MKTYRIYGIAILFLFASNSIGQETASDSLKIFDVNQVCNCINQNPEKQSDECKKLAMEWERTYSAAIPSEQLKMVHSLAKCQKWVSFTFPAESKPNVDLCDCFKEMEKNIGMDASYMSRECKALFEWYYIQRLLNYTMDTDSLQKEIAKCLGISKDLDLDDSTSLCECVNQKKDEMTDFCKGLAEKWEKKYKDASDDEKEKMMNEIKGCVKEDEEINEQTDDIKKKLDDLGYTEEKLCPCMKQKPKEASEECKKIHEEWKQFLDKASRDEIQEFMKRAKKCME